MKRDIEKRHPMSMSGFHTGVYTYISQSHTHARTHARTHICMHKHERDREIMSANKWHISPNKATPTYFFETVI